MRPLSEHSVAAFWDELEKIALPKLKIPGAPMGMSSLPTPKLSAPPVPLKPMAPSLQTPKTVSANSGVTTLRNNPRVPKNLLSS